MEIIQCKTTVAEASHTFDLTPSEVEEWVDEVKRGMENVLSTKPLEIHDQYKKQIKPLQEAYGEAIHGVMCQKIVHRPVGGGRQLIESVRQGQADDGIQMPVSTLYRCFEELRRAETKRQQRLSAPIKSVI